jgi:hypothetical protein
MKKTFKLIGIIALAAVIGLSMTTCEDGVDENIPVTFSSVSADGSSEQTTTQLTLTFSKAITGLTADNITLSGVSGVSKGTLSGSGPAYTLPISGFTSGGTLSVSVSKSGYDISGSPKSTTIYKNADDISVTFISVTADGDSSQTTTQLTLDFSQAITGLTAADITLSGVDGVIMGTLSGTGPTYTLPIGGFTSGGTLSVTVIKSGYTISGSPQSTTIYKNASDIPVTFSSVSANGSSSQTTTQLTLTFSQAISGLSASDISLSGVSGISKGTLSGSGPTYTLPISGFTSGGTLSVTVIKSGYTISGSPKSTTIYKNAGDISVSFIYVIANGSSSQTTTQLTLSFSQEITGLTENDIFLSGVSNVSKGTLSGTGYTSQYNYTLPISGFTSGGTLSVTVIKSGYTISGSPKSTTIYKNAGDISVTFSSVSADGSSTQTTTQLTLTFSQAISGLTADDISLSGVDGVSKGTLSGSGPTYTLPIGGFTSGGTLSVSVAKSGYEISGSPKSTAIYKNVNDIPVTFISVTADGNSSETTTQLTLTFSQAISSLTAADISLSGIDDVTKGSLSGSGPTYTLPVSGFTSGGTLSVAVSKTGYTISGSPKSTTIHYYSGGPGVSGMLTINNFPSGSSLGVNVYDYDGEIYSMSDIMSVQLDTQKNLAVSVGMFSASPTRLVGYASTNTFTGSGTYLVLMVNASTFQTWYAQQVTFTNGSAEIDFETMGLVSALPMTASARTHITINYWLDDIGGISIGTGSEPIAGNTVTVEYGGSITFAAGESGYTNHSWTLNGAAAGNDAEYTFDTVGRQQGKDYIVGLRVQKDGKPYFTQITVRIEE